MAVYLEIVDGYAREILDSRGNPTVEAEVNVKDGEHVFTGRASVPSGASTGEHEAKELRDTDSGRYHGKGVHQAVVNVNDRIKAVLLGKDAANQVLIDQILNCTDGTENKCNLGANATLSVSMACAKACAKALNLPLHRYLGGVYGIRMPMPMMNILNGGRHADNTVDFQEFMIAPVGAESFKEAMEIACEIYHTLKIELNVRNLSTGVGDEGGFAPNLPDAQAALAYIVRATEEAGYKAGEEVSLALDVAATELYDRSFKKYVFEGESKTKDYKVIRSSEELIDYYEGLIEQFPIVSIEDPLDEEDWDGWELLTTRLGLHTQLVGDDLFVTNTKRLKKGIEKEVANAILIKVNQIGTLTEALDTVEMAQKAGYRTIVSHRSGETVDTLIADLAVAVGAGQIKTGAPCRSERVEKYNQLLRIEERLGDVAEYQNPFK